MDTPNKPNIFMLFLLLFSVGMQLTLAVVVDIFSIRHIPAWILVIFSQVVVIGIPCAIYLIIHRKNIREILPLRRLGLHNTLMIIGMSIAIIPLANLLGAITAAVFGNPIAGTMGALADEGGIWLLLILISVLPSIFEEVALRGIVFSGYARVKIFTAAIINGLFFGILHQNFTQLSYAFVLGFVMCYMMWYTKSLWAPILCHFVINLIGSLMAYAGREIISPTLQEEAQYALSGVDVVATQELLQGVGVLSVVSLIFFGVFILIYTFFKKHNLRRNEEESIVTDTYTDAIRSGTNPPKAMTWGFWAAVCFGFLLMISMLLIG